MSQTKVQWTWLIFCIAGMSVFSALFLPGAVRARLVFVTAWFSGDGTGEDVLLFKSQHICCFKSIYLHVTGLFIYS